MTFFRFELRQMRKYTLIFSIALAVIIYGMLPVYLGFLDLMPVGEAMPEGFLNDNAFYNAIGANMKYLTTPIGMYGFLNSFVLLAGAISGTYLGMNAVVKEYMQRTTDYLLTKQYSRLHIYSAKLAAIAVSIFIISFSYAAGSLAAIMQNIPDFNREEFFLLVSSMFLIQFLFALVGIAAGACFPHIRTPLTVSSGISFVIYVLGAFSRKTNNSVTKFFCPFIYFDSTYIFEHGKYNSAYVAVYVFLCIVLAICGYQLFSKKDVLPTA